MLLLFVPGIPAPPTSLVIIPAHTILGVLLSFLPKDSLIMYLKFRALPSKFPVSYGSEKQTFRLIWFEPHNIVLSTLTLNYQEIIYKEKISIFF